MINEKININKLRCNVTFEKINNNKFILDYVTISLAGNCPDPLSKDIILIMKQMIFLL